MRHITDALEDLGYTLGVPGGRRARVRTPPAPSAGPDARLAHRGPPRGAVRRGRRRAPRRRPCRLHPCGFYWTEGIRGLGWAVNAVPTLKGGSSVGIASPPAVRLPSGEIVTPGLVDAERLQGFDPDWTAPAATVPGLRNRHRWKLVGNAVSVRMASWVGRRLLETRRTTTPQRDADAARRRVARAGVGQRSSGLPRAHLDLAGAGRRTRISADFLEDTRLLSARATAGFLKRARMGNLRFVPGFIDDVESHLDRMGGHPAGWRHDFGSGPEPDTIARTRCSRPARAPR